MNFLKAFIKKIELLERRSISYETARVAFEEFMKKYVLIMKEYVTFSMQKDMIMKRSMFSATVSANTGDEPTDGSKNQNV